MKELGFVIQHEISIKATCNKGFIIKIGCAVIAASSTTEALEILSLFLHDPGHWVKKYCEIDGPVSDDMPERAVEVAPPTSPETGSRG